ncbi:hypothetical protein B0H17DRAFT_1196159 [Mycena rosella]|uniref:DUF6534 domain-containing protein n=1 Tax=Mycena rosella TaxID=1033263 RepID=A0AAD7DWG7_MYCRO|nr:hypothetical protein B0H17DRAFT_1196159 [Mycena rosella]
MSQYVLLTGPILAGTQFNWALLGTLTLQVYIFHVSFPKERAWLKALVYTIFLLDVAQTAIASHFAYALLVNGWGDPTALTHLPWSSAAVPIFTGLISAAVQIFFAWRIYALKGKNPFALAISVLIILLALMQCFSAIISDALFSVTTELSEITKLMAGVKVWLIGSAACDIVITFTMIVILSHTVETGAITSIVAILDVVLFILFPNNYLHEAPAFMLGKVYSNVLLATLNQRGRTSAGVTATGNFASDDTELQWRRQTTTHEPEAQKIHITTVTEINSDLDSKMRRPRGPDF